MAIYPSLLKKRDELNLRLGIKSSLSRLRSVVASLYIIYLANKKNVSIIYTKESHNNGLSSISLDDNLAKQIDELFNLYDEKVSYLVNDTPLFSSQLEALQVGIELFFHLAKIDFVENGLSERTGSGRYQKRLSFTTNMILLDLYLSNSPETEVQELLVSWLKDQSIPSKLEEDLKIILTIFTEETQYKIRDNNFTEIIFNQENIYETVLNDGGVITKDANEPVGPFRIYKSFVSSGMHPYLKEHKQEISLINADLSSKLENYFQQVKTTLDIAPRKFVIESEITSVHNTPSVSIKEPSCLLYEYVNYLTALRTKPFMLLAGISGTGKSRIVREFAFKSCPPALQDAEGTTPGNYCMIEVKPNWHDSTEILGYYSNISQKYHFTKFVKFLVKAMMFPDVPFFVCLDEMNLAPVEQYFAEFLSVLETRKKDAATGVIQSGVLVAPEYFAPILNAETGNGHVAKYLCPEINVNIPYDIYKNTSLTTVGLTLPDNVFIIGTVNMDDTTHQFSRKVIDRAMTIEMNGGKLEDMFGHSADLQYLPEGQIMELSAFKPKYVNADEVMEEHSDVAEFLQEKLVEKLDKINDCLKNTPFQVSYRVLNELCIYAGVLLDDGEDIDNAISKAVDQITLMKILPRIEGDEDMFVTKEGNKLEQLQEIIGKESASGVKLEEMKERLKNSSFTRFWP